MGIHCRGNKFTKSLPKTNKDTHVESQTDGRSLWSAPLSLVEYNWGATGRESSGSGLGNRDYGRRNPSLWHDVAPSIRKSWH
jgi:hypothetical protein